MLSPYLWSGSNHYRRGKYRSDGEWDPDLVSRQIGSAVLLRRLAELDWFDPTEDAHNAADTGSPLVVGFHRSRPRDANVLRQALALQRWLNVHPGIYLREDGWPGARSADAYLRVTGHALPGAPA